MTDGKDLVPSVIKQTKNKLIKLIWGYFGNLYV